MKPSESSIIDAIIRLNVCKLYLPRYRPEEESVRAVMTRMTEGGLTAVQVKASIMRRSFKPDEEYVDAVIIEATRCLGVKNDEAL